MGDDGDTQRAGEGLLEGLSSVSHSPSPGCEAGAAHFDVCVVGGGSGGFGAACAAARHGARVLLVEAAAGLGGTSTWAGVNNWEPVAGPTGLPAELYERMRRRPLAAALQQRTAKAPERPGSWFVLAHADDYRLSLSRKSGAPIAFEPEALDRVMAEALAEQAEQGRCTVWLRTRFVDVQTEGGRIMAIRVIGPDGARWVRASVFVDATADLYLGRAAGCAARLGPDPRALYGEPAAPEQPDRRLNNASLCYRVAPLRPGEPRQIQPAPEGVDLDTIRPATSIRTYPNGDLNMNPVGLLPGWEAYTLDAAEPGAAYREAHRRALAHWHLQQTRYGFEDWRLAWVSPMLGVRETHRLVARYVLREQDIAAGLAAQLAGGQEDVVAIADHALDFHGSGPWVSREMPNGPYGVPFRCLLAREYDNLLVACRGAGFSAVAASSCRLSRTMMTLGQAAGTAAALFGTDVVRFDAATLRRQLQADGVALTLEDGYLDAMPNLRPLPREVSAISPAAAAAAAAARSGVPTPRTPAAAAVLVGA